MKYLFLAVLWLCATAVELIIVVGCLLPLFIPIMMLCADGDLRPMMVAFDKAGEITNKVITRHQEPERL